jgi:ATP-dependent Lhr-like helicase
VEQAIRDCLEEAMDIRAFEDLLRRLENGSVRVVARDLTEPSPLALEALTARPYTYLDDAPLEERRTQAVMSRRWIDPASAADIGKLDPEAIARVHDEAWPDAATPDELHDALLWLTFLTDEERRRNPAWPQLMDELAAQGRVASISWHPVHGAAPSLDERGIWWVASERRALFEPNPVSDEALVEIVRGRLEGLGPVTPSAVADSLVLAVSRVAIALAVLQSEGFAMRGRFTPGAIEEEWCDRRLLARIHRYTVKRLRAQIEPVPARDFLRFLFEWHRVLPNSRMQGSDAVAAVLAQLEGFETPAGAWETEVIPLRVADYEPEWLDEQCRSGRFVWTRLGSRAADRERGASPVRSTPIALLARRNVRVWSALTDQPNPAQLATRAAAVAEFLQEHGASFFDEIAESVGMLPVEVEEGLAELVAVGMVNSDGFAGLRALLLPSGRRGKATHGDRRKRRLALFGMADAGRWALVRRPSVASSDRDREGAVEQIVRTLLRRWGVIFWKLLAREASWLPPWREILLCCRRLEARGEIRGGRFVAGFSGEQYATPEAVGLLRDVRRKPLAQQQVSLSAADPLNLIGILTPGARLPSLTGNRLLYCDGLPIATYAAGEVRFLEKLAPKEEWDARTVLLRRHVPAALVDLAP